VKSTIILIGICFWTIPLWAQHFNFHWIEPENFTVRAGEGTTITGELTFDFEDEEDDYFDLFRISLAGEWPHLVLQRVAVDGNQLFLQQGGINQPHQNPQLARWVQDETDLIIRTASDGEENDPAVIAHGRLTVSFFAVAPQVVNRYRIVFIARRDDEGNNGPNESEHVDNITVIPTDNGSILLQDERGEPLEERVIIANEELPFQVALFDRFGNPNGVLMEEDNPDLQWNGNGDASFTFRDGNFIFLTQRAGDGIITAIFDDLQARSGRITIDPADPDTLIVINEAGEHVNADIDLTCDDHLDLWLILVDPFDNVIDTVSGDGTEWIYEQDMFELQELARFYRFLPNTPGSFELIVRYTVNDPQLLAAPVRLDVTIGRAVRLGLVETNNPNELLSDLTFTAGEEQGGWTIVGIDADYNHIDADNGLGASVENPRWSWRFNGLDQVYNGNNQQIDNIQFNQAPRQGVLHVSVLVDGRDDPINSSLSVVVNPNETTSIMVSLNPERSIEFEETWLFVGDTLDLYAHGLDDFENLNDDIQWNDATWSVPDRWQDDVNHPNGDRQHLRFTPQVGSGALQSTFSVNLGNLHSIESGLVGVHGGLIELISDVENLIGNGQATLITNVTNVSNAVADPAHIVIEANPNQITIDPENHQIRLNSGEQAELEFEITVNQDADLGQLRFTMTASWEIEGNPIETDAELTLNVIAPPDLSVSDLSPSESTEGTEVAFRITIINANGAAMINFDRNSTWLRFYTDQRLIHEQSIEDLVTPLDGNGQPEIFITIEDILSDGGEETSLDVFFVYYDAFAGGLTLAQDSLRFDDPFILYHHPEPVGQLIPGNLSLTPGFPTEVQINVRLSEARQSRLTLNNRAIFLRLVNDDQNLACNWPLIDPGQPIVLTNENDTEMHFTVTIPEEMEGGVNADMSLILVGTCIGGKVYNDPMSLYPLPINRRIVPIITGPAADDNYPHTIYDDPIGNRQQPRLFTAIIAKVDNSGDFNLHYSRNDLTRLIIRRANDDRSVSVIPIPSEDPIEIRNGQPGELEFDLNLNQFDPGDELEMTLVLDMEELGSGLRDTLYRASDEMLFVVEQPEPDFPADEENPVTPYIFLTGTESFRVLLINEANHELTLQEDGASYIEFVMDDERIRSDIVEEVVLSGEAGNIPFEDVEIVINGIYEAEVHLAWIDALGYVRESDLDGKTIRVLSRPNLEINDLARSILLTGEVYTPNPRVTLLDADDQFVANRNSYFRIVNNNGDSLQVNLINSTTLNPGGNPVDLDFGLVRSVDLPLDSYTVIVHLEGDYAGEIEYELRDTINDGFEIVRVPTPTARFAELEGDPEAIDPGESIDFSLFANNIHDDGSTVGVQPLTVQSELPNSFHVADVMNWPLLEDGEENVELEFTIHSTGRSESGFYNLSGNMLYTIPISVNPERVYPVRINNSIDDAFYIIDNPVISVSSDQDDFPSRLTQGQQEISVLFHLQYYDPTPDLYRDTLKHGLINFEFTLDDEAQENDSFSINVDPEPLPNLFENNPDEVDIQLTFNVPEDLSSGLLRILPSIEYQYGDDEESLIIATVESVPQIWIQTRPILAIQAVEVSSSRLTAGEELVDEDSLLLSLIIQNRG